MAFIKCQYTNDYLLTIKKQKIGFQAVNMLEILFFIHNSAVLLPQNARCNEVLHLP